MSDRFAVESVHGLAEPVRRYLLHSLSGGALISRRWRVEMRGRIRVGVRLPFTAIQDMDGSTFRWQASVPSSAVGLLKVTDSSGFGEDGTVGRILGRRVFADTGPDATRSAATRAVMESTIVPATLLPGSGAEWKSVGSDEIQFSRPEGDGSEPVTVRIDREGRAREVEALRWCVQKGHPGRLIPFRCTLEGERDFGGIRVPEHLTAGWVADGFTPFYWARITGLTSTAPRAD